MSAMSFLPIDVLRIIWSMCEGCPLRGVCKRWANAHLDRRVYFSMVNTVSMFEWLITCRKPTQKCVYMMAQHGHLKVLEWIWKELLETFPSKLPQVLLDIPYDDPEVFYHAATGGHVNVLEWRKSHTLKADATEVWARAAAAGHLHVLDWLCKNQMGGKKYAGSTFVAAARNGKLDTLQWLAVYYATYFHAGGSTEVCSAAAAGGHLDCLKWLRLVTHAAWNEDVCVSAVRGGHIYVLQWAMANGCPAAVLTSTEAIKQGNLAIIDFLVRSHAWYTYNMIRDAATYGHLHVIEWAYGKGYLLDSDATQAAAAHGYTHILAWLRAHGCHWDTCACTVAAQNGHLDTLRWIRGDPTVTCLSPTGQVIPPHGTAPAEFDVSIIACVSHTGQTKCMKWLRENGCGWGNMSIEYAIVKKMDDATIAWLKENGCPRTDGFFFRGK